MDQRSIYLLGGLRPALAEALRVRAALGEQPDGKHLLPVFQGAERDLDAVLRFPPAGRELPLVAVLPLKAGRALRDARLYGGPDLGGKQAERLPPFGRKKEEAAFRVFPGSDQALPSETAEQQQEAELGKKLRFDGEAQQLILCGGAESADRAQQNQAVFRLAALSRRRRAGHASSPGTA